MTIPADVLRRKGYRLPTEAEWEYACRSGSTTSRYYGLSSDLLDRYARYKVSADDHTLAGGSFRPNDFGLFDMLGNVYEWVQDQDYSYKTGQAQATSDSIVIRLSVPDSSRLLRGGAFLNSPPFVRSAYRHREGPSVSAVNCGFRLARTYD